MTHLDKSLGKWGQDRLTYFFNQARNNQFATFVRKTTFTKDIIRIDNIFQRMLDNPINPRPFVPMAFFYRSHAAYRAAVGLVMGGQLYEAQALLRLILEHAAYGFYVSGDETRWERWMRRGESEDDRKIVRREFTHGNMHAALTEKAERIGSIYDRLYNDLIDFGAHPNEQGFSMNTVLNETDRGMEFSMVHLHEDGYPLEYALTTSVRCGLCALFIMQLIYSAKFKILGLKNELDLLRKKYLVAPHLTLAG